MPSATDYIHGAGVPSTSALARSRESGIGGQLAASIKRHDFIQRRFGEAIAFTAIL